MHVKILSSFIVGPGVVAEVGQVLNLRRDLAIGAIVSGQAVEAPEAPAAPAQEPEDQAPEDPAPAAPANPRRRGAR